MTNKFLPEHKGKKVYSTRHGEGYLACIGYDTITIKFKRPLGDLSLLGGLRYLAKDGSSEDGDRVSF
jgi:hypothetical protein